MLPNKNTKPQQKNHFKQSRASKFIDEKNSQKSQSMKSKSNNSKHDPKVLLKSVCRNIDQIQKKLKSEFTKQQVPKSKDTKSDRSLVYNKDPKIQTKHGKTPQNNKPITNFLSKIPQITRAKESKPEMSKNQKSLNQKLNNNKDKQSLSGSDDSRTLSNDNINIKQVNKLSKKLQSSDSISSRSNSHMTNKNHPQLKYKKPLLKTPSIEMKSETSNSSIQRSVKSSKKQNNTKPKSSHKMVNQFIKIPSYSDEELRKIDIKINQMSQHQNNEAIEVILILMSWIWEAHLPFHKKESQIDSPKCFRKLLKLYENSSQLFSQTIALNKVKFQPEMYSEADNISYSQKTQSWQSYQKPLIQKIFLIYNLIKDFKQNNYKQVNASLIFLLFQILIFNYDQVSNLDEIIPPNIIRTFKNFHTKNKKYQTFTEIDHQILQELIIFTFLQLNYLKNNVDRSPQFIKKKKLEEILWKFFMDFIKIFHHQIKAKQFINFRISEALTLETSLYFLTEFTHYARRFPLKNLDQFVNMIEFEAFAETFIERVIEFHVYVLQLKDRQKNLIDIEIDGPNKLLGFNFDLPIYDWAILAIKSDERRTFDNLMKHCKKLFIKNLEKKSTSKYETFKNNSYVNDNYARFTIQQLPDEQRSFYNNSHHQQRKSPQEDNFGYKISYEKLKGFVSIPHMNFLVFKEMVPMSVKRLTGDSKLKHQEEKLEAHLLYLLILSNSQYLLKLINEIEFSCIEMLSPEIGKGLVRLCSYCHDFKSVLIGQKYLKLLRLNSLHKELTQRIFDNDIDYQRRLSTSMMTKNTTSRHNNSNGQKNQKGEQEKNEHLKIESSEILGIRIKSCETMYYEMIMDIENVIPFIKLDHYLHELLKKPTIFRPDKFYIKLLQTQHHSQARIYFQELISHYIEDKLKTVDLMTYFEMFANYCLKKDVFDEMLILVQSLSIRKLIKFHSLLFSETFTDQTSYHMLIPDGISREERFNILTSAGYQEKTKFIDQFCPSINQLIMWRDYFKPILSFEKIDKYISIKSFFTILHQVFSDPINSSKNHQCLNIVIDRLKGWIQKDKIDQVASAFHFLSLIFFPHQQSKINSNLSKNLMKDRRSFFTSKIMDNGTGISQKMTLQIFYIIRRHIVSLTEMFKNKQTLTIRCLGEEMRKKINEDEMDDKVDEMKRRQVMKMLNKMKNTHDYMIRCIVRLVENVTYTDGILGNFQGPEDYLETIKKICRCQHMQKDQKRIQAHDEYYTPKLNLKLSTVSSNNLFQSTLQKYLKKYNENSKYFHERYHFLVMIRCIAQMWIDQKSPSSRDVTKMENQAKSKSLLIVNNKYSKSKDKNGGQDSLSAIISVEKIFDICIECLKNPISAQNGIRECEMLKQKLVAFETLSILFSSFSNKMDILKFMAPSVAKAYKTKYHHQICQIILQLLMNNVKILGKEDREKELVTVIRLKALSLLIQNYRGDEGQVAKEWKILQTIQHFWFLINTLVFDKNAQIRLLIIKSLYSRQKKLSGFRESFVEKLVISVLMASQEYIKPFAKISKKCLSYTLEKFFVTNHTSSINVLNLTAMKYFSYLVNFNTVHFLQKGQLKLQYKEFFEVWVDLIFDKREAETYLYAIISYFNEIAKSSSVIDISELFIQLKWPIDIDIDFYLITKPSRVRLSSEFNTQKSQNNKDYLQLLQDINNQLQKNKSSKKPLSVNELQVFYDKKYPKCNEIFKANINEALSIMHEVFLQRAAKANKRQIKTKKPQSVLRNFGGIFNPNLKEKKEKLKSHKTKKQEKKPANETEVEI